MGYKGEIFYDIHSGKFIISSHVIDEENVYHFKQFSITKDTSSRLPQRSSQNRVVIQVPIVIKLHKMVNMEFKKKIQYQLSTTVLSYNL